MPEHPPLPSSTRQSHRGWALAFAAVIVAAACSFGTGDGTDRPAAPSPGGSQRASMSSAEEFKEDFNGAIKLAEIYWGERFERAGRRFGPVRQVISYTRDGEASCGGQPIPTNNAVYCPAGDFIAYDVNFAVRAFNRIGDAFLYYLLGHEYAHAIQVRLGLEYKFTIEQELQADCMAGAYLADSIKAKRLTLDPGDIEEFQSGLLAVGDDPSIPWFAPGAHGTAQQRATAFFAGYNGSLAPCGNTAALLGVT